ncbi:MAG: 30S ribosomal protein S18 [Tissierellia bacterium]|nr:30S ribosomal protein S18 [Tissierellia bacterium]
MQKRYRSRKKVCIYCQDKDKKIDYKDTQTMKKFISDRGKILPRRVTGACAKHQRKITTAIKRGRQVALLPYSAD